MANPEQSNLLAGSKPYPNPTEEIRQQAAYIRQLPQEFYDDEQATRTLSKALVENFRYLLGTLMKAKTPFALDYTHYKEAEADEYAIEQDIIVIGHLYDLGIINQIIEHDGELKDGPLPDLFLLIRDEDIDDNGLHYIWAVPCESVELLEFWQITEKSLN
jgi:hypothetical protein